MKSFLKYLFVILLFSIFFCSCDKKPTLHEGDILFQDIDCGPLCDAIENVTYAYKNYNISHCGIVVCEGKKFYVIEAYEKVQKTPLKVFLNRSVDKNGNPKVIVGRLNREYKKSIPIAIFKAYSLLGKPYDEYFEINNDKYYCSELIYEIFLKNNKDHIFPLVNMTYKNPKTGKTADVWVKYFSELGKEIPEGKLGSNPANYSVSEKITIIHEYGQLSSKK